jgi:hypothetical protein
MATAGILRAGRAGAAVRRLPGHPSLKRGCARAEAVGEEDFAKQVEVALASSR